VFENRVLRRIFGQKRDEVTEGWRKLHNNELHNLYSSPSIIRMRLPHVLDNQLTDGVKDVSLTRRPTRRVTVEAGSNISVVALRVVGEDAKGIQGLGI
jgi:hypothetical protein